MENRVLVTYASKHGATAEIAEKIGEVLQKQGLQIDVLPVDRVGEPTQYKAVVMGSAVYMGQWRKEAVKFINNNEKLLAGRSVWIFSSGPAEKGDPVQLLKVWKYPGKIQPFIDRIKPRDITVFHGVVDTNKLNALERYMIKMVKSSFGDFRDWDAIAAWAAGIAEELKQKTAGK